MIKQLKDALFDGTLFSFVVCLSGAINHNVMTNYYWGHSPLLVTFGFFFKQEKLCSNFQINYIKSYTLYFDFEPEKLFKLDKGIFENY